MNGLTVVVVSWNTRTLTGDCLDAVAAAGADFSAETGESLQCVLVDNGSADGTVESVRAERPFADVVALDRNRGFAAGANQGLARAHGDVVLFLNTDVRIEAATLVAAWRHLAAAPRTAIVAPQLLHPDGRLQNSAHAFPGAIDELVPGWLIDRILPGRRPAKRTVGRAPRPVDAVQGAALFARRQVLDALGGFCDDYFFYLEETDLCWRARDAGHDVELLPGTALQHAAGVSSKRVDAAASRIEYHRSLYRFLARRRGPGTMWLAVVLRTLRGLFTVMGLGLASPFSRRARGRWAERAALLRWHLAGRPVDRGLAFVGRGDGGATSGRRVGSGHVDQLPRTAPRPAPSPGGEVGDGSTGR